MFADLAHIAVSIHAECTDPNDFARRLHEHSQRIAVGPGPGAIPIEITIDTSSAPVIGRLTIGSAAPRTVEGATCDEVADALGLIVALTFDPDSHASARPAPERAPSSPPAIVLLPPRRSMIAPPLDDRLRVHLGAHFSAALIDQLPVGSSVFLELGRRATKTTARLSLSRFGTSVTDGDGALGARFVWTYGALEVCPLRFGSPSSWTVTPCGGAVMGVLYSEATRGGGGSSPSFAGRAFHRAWVGPRLALRGSVHLADRMSLEAHAALDVPVVRDDFTFADVRVYRIPAVVPLAAVGLSVELP